MSLLKDRVAIITGAGSKRGLGRATAQLFAEHGARIAVLDLRVEDCRDTVASLAGSGHLAIACDVTVAAACQRAVADVLGVAHQVDVLVNNAGISQAVKLADITRANYDDVLDVNLRGTLLMTQAVLAHMRGRKSGSIINMASVSAQRGGGIFGGPHYSAAKGGILGLTKASARELAPDNVRVNAICPSLIDTDIVHSAPGWTKERELETLKSIPMGRAGKAREVAGCALFLASDLSSYVTGSEIDVNGGSHIH
jgi:NAD(P)-dependent dehydrogenase (short-subunit alcohol dehydrogenase family)